MNEKLIPVCSEERLDLPRHQGKQRLCSTHVLPYVTLVLLLPVTIALLTSTISSMGRMNTLESELKTLRHNFESLATEYETTSEDSYYDEDDDVADYEPIIMDALLNDTLNLHHTINKSAHVRSRRSAPEDREPRRGKKIEAYHLHVDSSMYSMEIEHAGETLNVWTDREAKRVRFGELQNNGKFKVKNRGLYYIYSQITYYDNSGRWCHAIKKNSNIIAKCLASEMGMSVDEGTNHYVPTVHNCFTATVAYLRADDELSITSLYGRRTIHQGTDMTFWGVIKLA